MAKEKIHDVIIANIQGDTLHDLIDQVIGAGYKLSDFKNIIIDYQEHFEGGDNYMTMGVSILREETDEEEAERARRHAKSVADQELRARATYERLKARFG